MFLKKNCNFGITNTTNTKYTTCPPAISIGRVTLLSPVFCKVKRLNKLSGLHVRLKIKQTLCSTRESSKNIKTSNAIGQRILKLSLSQHNLQRSNGGTNSVPNELSQTQLQKLAPVKFRVMACRELNRVPN